MAISSTTFKKGTSGNPKGTHATSNKTLIRRAFENNAEIDADKIYKRLLKAIEAGESWAHQIFWKEVLPKKIRTVLIDKSKDRLEALVEGLDKFEELTHDEILKEIKALSLAELRTALKESSQMKEKVWSDDLLGRIEQRLAEEDNQH